MVALLCRPVLMIREAANDFSSLIAIDGNTNSRSQGLFNSMWKPKRLYWQNLLGTTTLELKFPVPKA